jgi:glutathione S-transferase kappa 1
VVEGKVEYNTYMASHTIVLFVDVASPYTWLAFETLARYSNIWKNVKIEYRPFFLGGVMGATGNRPPGLLPAKGKYMAEDLKRAGLWFKVPIKFPKDEGVIMRTLLAQRLLTATMIDAPHFLEPLMRALWTRIWSLDEEIAGPSGLRAACHAVGMHSSQVEALMFRIGEPDVKEKLKMATQQAIEWGSFGAPSIFVFEGDTTRRHHFFGSDRFDQIADLIHQPWYGPAPLQAQKSSL